MPISLGGKYYGTTRDEMKKTESELLQTMTRPVLQMALRAHKRKLTEKSE